MLTVSIRCCGSYPMMSRSEVLRAQPSHNPMFLGRQTKYGTPTRAPKTISSTEPKRRAEASYYPLAQLCNPTAKGSSKVPRVFRFLGFPWMHQGCRTYWENLLLLNPPNKELQVIWLEDFYFMKSPVTPCPWWSILPCWGPERNKFHHWPVFLGSGFS